MQFTLLALSALSALTLTSATPLRRAADECTDPSGNPQFEWFITPSQGTSCNSNLPNYRPNSGYDDTASGCAPLYNLEADPNGATTFTSASVTTPCGGWNVTLFSTSDCSDQGMTVTGTNSAPACVLAADGSPFAAFNAVAA